MLQELSRDRDPALASAAGVPYVAGVAAGYKFARSAAPTAVTGTLDINSGLATVVSVVVTASSDMDGTSLAAVSGVITGAAGHFTAKCWKVTTGGAAGNPTLIAADAEQVYREDLKRFPENGWSLFGLGQALHAQGKHAEAAQTDARFRTAWQGADVTLVASRF